jgi:hypothetical protein
MSPTGVTELSAQECATAWLVLITIDHPDLDTPIRVTSDGVETISQGNVFAPFPFEVTLPDDVEGRTPQALLKIDNTSLEVIALLRGLASPPVLTLQIVRSADPDEIEREWVGIEWRSSQYDVGAITGTLTVEDLATEEFPYVTFDGRFKGLWP